MPALNWLLLFAEHSHVNPGSVGGNGHVEHTSVWSLGTDKEHIPIKTGTGPRSVTLTHTHTHSTSECVTGWWIQAVSVNYCLTVECSLITTRPRRIEAVLCLFFLIISNSYSSDILELSNEQLKKKKSRQHNYMLWKLWCWTVERHPGAEDVHVRCCVWSSCSRSSLASLWQAAGAEGWGGGRREGRGQRHLSLLLSAECCEAVNSCIQRVVQKIEMALRRVHRQRQRFSSHCNDLNTLWWELIWRRQRTCGLGILDSNITQKPTLSAFSLWLKAWTLSTFNWS